MVLNASTAGEAMASGVLERPAGQMAAIARAEERPTGAAGARTRATRELQGGPRGCPNASISQDRVFER